MPEKGAPGVGVLSKKSITSFCELPNPLEPRRQGLSSTVLLLSYCKDFTVLGMSAEAEVI